MGAVLPVAALAAGCASLLGGLFGGDSQPAQAPTGPSPDAVFQLNQQLAEVRRLRSEFEQETAQTRLETEQQQQALRERAEVLQRREEELAREAEEQRRQEEEARNYPLQPYQVQSNWEGTVNVGLVGNSGVGKSLLSNHIRQVQRGQPEWSPVGVNETTQEPRMYAFPGEARARLWDLPGAGTAAHPRGTYIREVGLRHFDAVLVVSAGRFTETEQLLIAELQQYQVPFFAVRTKLDLDITNNEDDNGITPEETKRAIADDLRMRGIVDPYLINAKAANAHDFPKLLRDLHAAVVANRRVAGV